MNKLINSLFEKDLVVKIVSILTAILIWFVVLDTENPFEERTIAVPLTSNVDVLQNNNFQIVGTPLPAYVDVKIKGRRQKISSVTANDFKVDIDLSGVTVPGYKRININAPEYLGDQDIIMMGINPSSVTLNFERVVGKQYPVEIEFIGSLPSGYELVNLKVEPNNVILEEKESSMSMVSKVVAYVNLDEADDNKEIVMRAVILDSEGQPLRQFEGKVPVIVSFNLAKKVPVIASIKGNPANDYYLKEITYSLSNVRVIGSKSVLDRITNVNTEAIDITDKSETFTAPLTASLPKGATLFAEDAERLSADVVIEKYVTRNINMSSSHISIFHGDTAGTMNYRITNDTVPITIKGKSADVNAVKASDIKLSVYVSDLLPGEHEVPLTVKVPNSVSLIGEYSVNITITAIPPVENNPVVEGAG
ncbi:MAG: YbbR-like domain-containing protein [Acetivibrionales bacterium]|jgi:YbbR domain-containing protein